jgi:hypothetical protein
VVNARNDAPNASIYRSALTPLCSLIGFLLELLFRNDHQKVSGEGHSWPM